MSTKKSETIDFEKSLAELEKLVEQMEQGELSLEQSLAHFEHGVRLTRSCQQALEQARLKVNELLNTDQDDASPTSEEQ